MSHVEFSQERRNHRSSDGDSGNVGPNPGFWPESLLLMKRDTLAPSFVAVEESNAAYR